MKGLLDDIFKSLKHPISDDDWASKVIVISIVGIASLWGIESFIYGGGAYSIAWILEIALAAGSCLYLGYLLEAMRVGFDYEQIEEFKMPELANWGTMFTNGMLMLVIDLIYWIVPFVLFFVISGYLYAQKIAVLPPGEVGPAMQVRDICQFIAALLFVATSFFIPMATANFLHKENIGAAFAMGDIIGRIKHVLVDYLRVVQLWILGIVLCTWILMKFGTLGLVIVPIVMMYVSAGVFIEVGKLYNRVDQE